MPSSKTYDDGVATWEDTEIEDDFMLAPDSSPPGTQQADTFEEIMQDEIYSVWSMMKERIEEEAIPILQMANFHDFMQFVLKHSDLRVR